MTERIYCACRTFKNVISPVQTVFCRLAHKNVYRKTNFVFPPLSPPRSSLNVFKFAFPTLLFSLLALNWKAKVRNYCCKRRKLRKKLSRKETFIWLNVIFSYETPLCHKFSMAFECLLCRLYFVVDNLFVDWLSCLNLKDKNQFHSKTFGLEGTILL